MKIRTGLGLYPRVVRLANGIFDSLGLPLLMGPEVRNYKREQLLKDAPARERIISLISFLTPQKANGERKIRLGNKKGDGGYVSIDTGKRIRHALSFGVENDDSWDMDCANRGIRVYQYDHSIGQAPHQHPLTKFHKKKISTKKDEIHENIASILAEYSLIEDSSVILKIDIEGSEWEVFAEAAAETLNKFDQIICEFHYFGAILNDEWYERAYRALERLHKVFGVVHVHANNNGSFVFPGNVPFPHVLEVTFANRNHYQLEESAETFPTEIDIPNRPNWPDLYLGNFQFKGLRK